MVWQDILIVLFMVVLNGFFAMSELAVVSSRRGRLQQYALEHRRGFGLGAPAQFIPAAKDRGLIQPIRAWVLRKTSTQRLLGPACCTDGRHRSPCRRS